jgi:simple sugar transport system permease protein
MSVVSTETGAGERASWPDRLRYIWQTKRAALPTVAAMVIFVGMLAYGEAVYGRILQNSTMSNLFINNAHLVLIAVGMTFVILMGGIDLSVGAVIAFSSVAGVMLVGAGWDPWLVMVLMVAMGAGFGTVSGVLIQYFNVQPFIATLATMFLARGLASMLSTVPERLPEGSALLLVDRDFKLVDGPRVNDLIVTPGVIIAALVVVAAVFALHRSRFGRTIYAIGGSEQSALLMGLPVARTKVAAYVISGSLAGLAAVVYTSRLGAAQNITGIGWELDAIAATVIGGTLLTGGAGFVLGSVVGALVLGLMTVLITRDGDIPPEATTIITGGILLIFVLLQRAVVVRRRE